MWYQRENYATGSQSFAICANNLAILRPSEIRICRAIIKSLINYTAETILEVTQQKGLLTVQIWKYEELLGI